MELPASIPGAAPVSLPLSGGSDSLPGICLNQGVSRPTFVVMFNFLNMGLALCFG